MNKSETIQAFEAALKGSRELQEQFAAAEKRIIENKEAASDGEVLMKAAAAVGFTLSEAELERSFAQMQELDEEELMAVAGGSNSNVDEDYWCFFDYFCYYVVNHDMDERKVRACWNDFVCNYIYYSGRDAERLENQGL